MFSESSIYSSDSSPHRNRHPLSSSLSGSSRYRYPIFWPSFDAVGERFVRLFNEGFRNIALWDHVSISIYRVLSGVFFGALLGIPLGFAMGLWSVARGFFDSAEIGFANGVLDQLARRLRPEEWADEEE